jgi:hypothetical protein
VKIEIIKKRALYAISDIPQKFGSKYEMENKEN